MTATIGTLLEQRLSSSVVGRDPELAALGRLLEDDGPLVALVQGIGGIGKTTLVRAFAEHARARGATVLLVDGAEVEPTGSGLLASLCQAAGTPEPSLEALAARLVELGEQVVLVVDSYERLRLIDAWVRRELVPALPGHTRVVVSGRELGLEAWRAGVGPTAPVFALALGGLDDTSARRLAARAGLSGTRLDRLVSLCRGHPLALRVATSSAARTTDVPDVDAAASSVMAALTATYLDELDPLTRRIVQAASVPRHVTRSVLASLLPEVAPQDAVDRLRGLPFVELTDDGLRLHEAVQHAIAGELARSDPETSLEWRRLAWRHVRAELDRGGTAQLWRQTADMLWLIDNPVVREAFFPSGDADLTVEPAGADDGSAVLAIAERHEPAEAAEVLRAWWQADPSWFRVVRRPGGELVAFYAMAPADRVPAGLRAADPVTDLWLRHAHDDGIPRHQTVLLMRRFLAAETGEAPSPGQGACWRDVKRVYMLLRPALRRLYSTLADPSPYAAAAAALMFTPLPDAVDLGGTTYYQSMLDFGPSSVDGWLARLAASELGIVEATSPALDGRELRVGCDVVALSRLESELLAYLMARPGRAVPRAELLAAVWDNPQGYGSNVVDATVRTLRRRLEGHGLRVETVKGVGYRYRA